MAKKQVKKSANVTPGYKPHAAHRCDLAHCMGNPKKLIEASTFDGSLCAECNLVFEYKPHETVEAEQKAVVKEEKIKKKTIAPDEKEIEKLIKEADKKEKKKVKKSTGEQGQLF